MMSYSMPENVLICHVCGDAASGRHYGVPSCDGCRGFFKRSVRRKVAYACKYGGNCVVDVLRRNHCQSCRFQKCLRVSMKREAVQSVRQFENVSKRCERSGRSLYNCNTQASRVPRKYIPPFIRQAQMNGSETVKAETDFFCHWMKTDRKHTERLFQLEEEKTGDSFSVHSQEFLLLSWSRSCIACEMAFCSQLCGFWPFVWANPSHLAHIGITLLLDSLLWCANIPAFLALDTRNQITLIRDGWPLLAALTAIQLELSMERDFERTHFEGFSQALRRMLSSQQLLHHLNLFNEIKSIMKSLATDQFEWSGLKAISLFRPDVGRLNEAEQIPLILEQSEAMLRRHVTLNYPFFPFRIQKLFLVISYLSRINHFLRQLLNLHWITSTMEKYAETLWGIILREHTLI